MSGAVHAVVRYPKALWGSQLGKVTENLGKVRKFNGVTNPLTTLSF